MSAHRKTITSRQRHSDDGVINPSVDPDNVAGLPPLKELRDKLMELGIYFHKDADAETLARIYHKHSKEN